MAVSMTEFHDMAPKCGKLRGSERERLRERDRGKKEGEREKDR
jgi:hypothetical protein